MTQHLDDADLVSRLTAMLPRYTSYPPANHFSPSVGAAEYRAWLAALADDSALSLYLHIPFCEQLCWYCACSTKATQRYEPVARYLATLEAESQTVSQLLPQRHRLTHMHWGGGSPDILSADDIRRLGKGLARLFNFVPGSEFAVEIDPRLISAEKADALVEIGVNRISIGVQDFDDIVQNAIGRVQSYAVSKHAVDLFRDRGVGSVNVDLVYGLPHQTTASLNDTLEKVTLLGPDRIAVFGYAHLPQRAPNQRLIEDDALPGPMQRFRMARQLAQFLEKAGYQQRGLDHFAKSDDRLATQPLNRNFQGYTTDSAAVLIGLGASAIGRLPQGYVQNAVATHDYAERIAEDGLATRRGWRLSVDDRVRAFIIERLMCDFTFSGASVREKFGFVGADLLQVAQAILAEDQDGLVEATDDGFRLTPRGRPFVRNVCARFDSYLHPAASAAPTAARHSLSV